MSLTIRRFLLVPLFVLASCADLSKSLTESNSLVSQFSSKFDGLLASGQSLQDRAGKIASDVPGANALVGKLSSNQGDLMKLKDDFMGSPAKIDDAIKAGNADEVNRLLESQKAMTTTGFDGAVKKMDGLKGEVTALESKAASLEAEKAKAAAMASKPAEPAPVEAPKAFAKSLPGGFALSGNPNGIEAQLVGFIEDAGKPVDKTTWFNFDRLTFKLGKAELDMEVSKAQLTNITEILKAYPAVKLKVGGYTDNQGNAAANQKLSAARATAVQKAIVAMGVKADRLDPEGFGSQFPVCPANDTDACRAQNRRVSVRVTAK
jgi:outer membrane protein OmpA-like peptidoglycan-associated protein